MIYDPDTGTLDEKSFLEFLENHDIQVSYLLAEHYKSKALKYTGWNFGKYYELLWQDSLKMYVMLKGLAEM